MPVTQDVHIDAALSQLSIGYSNSGYIADQMFPSVPVKKQSDKYYIWTKDYWFRNYVQKRAPGDTYPEGKLELSNSPYFADIFHLSYPIPDENVANADEVIEEENAGAEWLADQFLLNKEAQFSADFSGAGVWTGDVTPGTLWDTLATSDPIGDVQTGLESVQTGTGKRPNTILMNQEVFGILLQHPDILDRYKYTTVANLSKEQVAAALGVERVVVASAIANASQEGLAFSGEWIWPDHVLLAYVSPTVGKRTATAGITFTWDMGSGLDTTIQNIREENRDRSLLKGKQAWDQVAVATDLGYRLNQVIS